MDFKAKIRLQYIITKQELVSTFCNSANYPFQKSKKGEHPANTVTKDEYKTDVGKINSLPALEFVKRSAKSKQDFSLQFDFQTRK